MARHLSAEFVLTMRTLLRLPGFWIPTVLFPGMLYSFFGSQSGGEQWAANAMASFAVYAVLGVGFFQFGVSVAQDRGSPFAVWQRTLPGSVAYQWIARTLASLIFTTIAVLIVVVLAFTLAEFDISVSGWARLGATCLLATVTATLLGIALGTVTPGTAAVPVANLIYLPLAYLGGLWVPPMALPSAVNSVSQWTPSRAMGELGWAAVNGTEWSWFYLASLFIWTALACGLIFAANRYRS